MSIIENDLRPDSTELSAAYRRQPGQAILLDSRGKHAYLAARAPATFAAALRVLERLSAVWPQAPESLLDAGCGPGVAGLAAAQIWPDIAAVTRSDLDGAWRSLAERLGKASGHPALASARWLTGALDQIAFPAHDCVVVGYALNEVPAQQRQAALRNLWRAASKAMILIEPGTPQGFLNIQAARQALILEGAHIAAPCTHHGVCPMSEKDWCHNAVRLERSAVHRASKAAQLSYEDEKFAYLAVVRAPVATRPAYRIVKRPMAHTGHVRLDLCGPEGLSRTTVSRRDGATYKAARAAEWGDPWSKD